MLQLCAACTVAAHLYEVDVQAWRGVAWRGVAWRGVAWREAKAGYETLKMTHTLTKTHKLFSSQYQRRDKRLGHSRSHINVSMII